MEMKNVYIVDDNAGMRQSLEQLLSAYGYETHSFPDGSSFLDNLDTLDAGVAVIDLRMPRISGFEVLREIANEKGQIVPLAISALAAAGTADKALNLGAKAFFPKPFDEGTLLSRLNVEFQAIANTGT